MAQLSEIRDWVRQQTLIEEGDWSDTKVNAVINEGVRRLSTRFPWPFLLTSTTISALPDQQAYDLPSDHVRTHTITNSTQRTRLREMSSVDAWDLYGGDFPEAYRADAFFLHGSQVYLIPTPTDALFQEYTHRYYRSPTLLTNDTDSPEWASQFHLVLADYAIARAWEREEDFVRAEIAQTAFDRGIEEMAQFYLGRTEPRPMVFGEYRAQPRRAHNLPWLDGV